METNFGRRRTGVQTTSESVFIVYWLRKRGSVIFRLHQKTIRYGILDLLVLVANFAIAAFLVSIGYWASSLLWLGFWAGVKLGARSTFPTLLIVFFGMVAGALFAAAISATLAVFHLYPLTAIDYIESRSKTIAANTRGLLVGGALVLWVPPVLMTIWLTMLPFRPTRNDEQQRGPSD